MTGRRSALVAGPFRRVTLIATATLVLGAAALPAPAKEQGVPPYRAADESVVALNILPPGQGRYMNAAEAAHAQATGEQPPHNTDQLARYESLVQTVPHLSRADLSDLFKDASFGVRPDDVGRVYAPRAGITVVRDAGFGVPHVYGDTRGDVLYGAGYVSAEDRLFMMDVFRHAARGRLSEFLGASPANLAMDRATYRNADYTEDELEAMGERLLEIDPKVGGQVNEDIQDYVGGINAYIQEALTDPRKLPAEYAALQQVPKPWKITDTIAIAGLIGATFGVGGGGELSNAGFVSALRDAGYSETEARAIMGDLRFATDPEAPTETDEPFPWNADLGPVDPAAVAVPDDGGEAARQAAAATPPSLVDGPFGPIRLFAQDGASNSLLVGSRLSAAGRPLAVFGPQVGYWSPEILMELDLHGPGIHARGAGFPGISLYVLLGRGRHYGWSATSAGADNVDIFAVRLCEPGGAEPTQDSDHYIRGGECVPLYRRTDTWVAKPTAGGLPEPDPSDPVNDNGVVVRMTTERADVPDDTVPGGFRTGIVQARGTVEGTPAAFVKVRSTYGAEVDSALTYATIQNPNTIASIEDLRRAFFRFNFNFNWFLIDGRDTAFQLTGALPERAPGVDMDLPVWAKRRWAWQDMLSYAETPHDVSPAKGFTTSWNNKQAPGFRAADDNWAYGPVHRSQPLDDRIRAAAEDDGKVSLTELVWAMGDAATVDLRGDKVLPYMLQVIGDPGTERLRDAVELLDAWHQSGAHRRDLDGDGEYEQQAAVALMDAWWDRVLDAAFHPVLRDAYDDVPLDHDDEPGPVGSAYISGWYGQLHKDLRTVLGLPVEGPFSRGYCGKGDLTACRQALTQSLDAAVAAMEERFGPDPGSWDADEARDQIRFTTLGLQGQRPMAWQNRPTFQQVLRFESPPRRLGAPRSPRPDRWSAPAAPTSWLAREGET